jgi:squalene cyclase
MLNDIFAAKGLALEAVVGRALAYFDRRRMPDGCIVDDPGVVILHIWDSVNALKALTLWKDRVGPEAERTLQGLLSFLKSQERPTGMISWGSIEIAPREYCTETTAEYIMALGRLGRVEEARQKLMFLRTRQLATGPWEEVHPHVPRAFQTTPSVTGFTLQAMVALDVKPLYLDEALTFLVKSQKEEGHWGINWFFLNTPYYLTRPVSACMTHFGYYAAVARLRDYVLSQQRGDGSWHTELEGFGRALSPELHTALALETLACCGLDADEAAVRRGVSWLLERQQADGSWLGGVFPYPDADVYRSFKVTQDVYTTSQVLSALHKLSELESSL